MATSISSMGSSRFFVEPKDRMRWVSASRRAASSSRFCILVESSFYNMMWMEEIRAASAVAVSKETGHNDFMCSAKMTFTTISNPEPRVSRCFVYGPKKLNDLHINIFIWRCRFFRVFFVPIPLSLLYGL